METKYNRVAKGLPYLLASDKEKEECIRLSLSAKGELAGMRFKKFSLLFPFNIPERCYFISVYF